MTDAAASLTDLTVRYGRTTVVDGVSTTLPKGAVYALLGRNGAGKSSLLRCWLGLQWPDRGVATLLGQNSWHHRAALMGRVGVVPEEPDAPPSMTAASLARFVAPLYATWDTAGYDARLRRFDVPRDVPFGRLSKGQKGQVMLSLALAQRPELLILDDPTLGLDAVARAALFDELIDELHDRGTTILLTSHDFAGIEPMATHVAILRRGRLVVDEPLESLKGRCRRVSFASTTSDGDAQAALAPLTPLGLRRGSFGLEAVVTSWRDDALAGLRRQSPQVLVEAISLERVFLAHVEQPS